MRVLVVEDDPGIAASLVLVLVLVLGLERAGYRARSVDTGREALAADPEPDVVLLDLRLPDLDGVEVCRRLRSRSRAAIIVVTARGEEADRVAVLDEGADDYLVKTFGLAELLARIRAVLRRVQPSDSELLRHGPLAVDLRTRKVTVGTADARGSAGCTTASGCSRGAAGATIPTAEHGWPLRRCGSSPTTSTGTYTQARAAPRTPPSFCP